MSKFVCGTQPGNTSRELLHSERERTRLDTGELWTSVVGFNRTPSVTGCGKLMPPHLGSGHCVSVTSNGEMFVMDKEQRVSSCKKTEEGWTGWSPVTLPDLCKKDVTQLTVCGDGSHLFVYGKQVAVYKRHNDQWTRIVVRREEFSRIIPQHNGEKLLALKKWPLVGAIDGESTFQIFSLAEFSTSQPPVVVTYSGIAAFASQGDLSVQYERDGEASAVVVHRDGQPANKYPGGMLLGGCVFSPTSKMLALVTHDEAEEQSKIRIWHLGKDWLYDSIDHNGVPKFVADDGTYVVAEEIGYPKVIVLQQIVVDGRCGWETVEFDDAMFLAMLDDGTLLLSNPSNTRIMSCNVAWK